MRRLRVTGRVLRIVGVTMVTGACLVMFWILGLISSDGGTFFGPERRQFSAPAVICLLIGLGSALVGIWVGQARRFSNAS